VLSQEWSLVAFTVLAQAAAGMSVALAAAAAAGAFMGRTFRRALGAATLVMAGALLVSFLHLGDPIHAVYGASHWRSSWLSREIVAAVTFLALQCATLLAGGRGRTGTRLFHAMLGATALAGLALVAAMARVYAVPTVPSWRGPATPIAFGVTTVLLGAAGMLAVFSADLRDARARILAWWLLGAIAVALLVKLCAAVLLGPPAAAEPAAFPAAAPGGPWSGAPWVAAALGVAALAGWVLTWRRDRPSSSLVPLAVVAFLIAEVIARGLFYASYFRLGV